MIDIPIGIALVDYPPNTTDYCAVADKYPDGTCKGWQKGEFDDEPLDKCEDCKSFGDREIGRQIEDDK